MIRRAVPSLSTGSASRRADDVFRLRGIIAFLDPRMGRAGRGESGSSIVEFAMASIILFTLIFGVMAICVALYSYNVVSEAAREGSRYAIVRGAQCHFPSGPSCPTSQPDIQTYVQSIGFPGINPNSLLVPTVNWVPDNNPGSQVQVTVTYTFPLTIPFVPSRTLTMSSTSQMVISQ